MYRILLVDDEYETRNGLSHYFPWSEIGFHIAAQKENGKEALEYMEWHPVDVLLSDIRMPIMSGLELAKAVMLRKWPTKIILLTGHKDFEYARQAVNLGASRFITKPSSFEEIRDVF
ncbi:response regulator [Paenibacillus hamazuiensis]|uniref:response regulator n=1 Tax=Paenibacillus hamazuiensis TaxID=2936508 RepID=UPI00200F5A04|nr:response regulator [Paenibacillus hamazuiensis]